MALSFIILTLLIAGSIIAGSYSMYLPFFISMQQSTQQIEAYYMARAAMERGQLVVQYHPLGFAGSGGFDSNGARGPSGESTTPPHIDITKMGWHTNNQHGSDTDKKIYVNKPIKIYLGYDNTIDSANYYQDIADYAKYEGNEVSINIQIPPELINMGGEGEGSSLLCNTENIGCDIDNDDVYDDTIIQRDRKGQEGRGVFSIIPYTSTHRGAIGETQTVNYSQDTNIRESIINIENTPTLLFTNTFNPIAQNDLPDAWTGHNTSGGVWSGIQSQTFSDLLTNNDIEYNIISLQMLHPGIRRDSKIYPYMHYKINGEDALASPMNTIQAYAQTDQSNITIQASKPNILTQEKGSFIISTSTNE